MKNMDKHLLGQHIRFNAHMLDVATKSLTPDLSARHKNNIELEKYLSEWDRREYLQGPDYHWARQRAKNYERWLIDRKIELIQPVTEKFSSSDVDTLMEMIKTRRTVRFWQKKPVNRALIDKIIEAGTFAPTAFNRMELKYFVAETPQEKMQEGDSSNPSMFDKAPVRIFIAADERMFFEKYSGSLDTGLAMQNMILMAHALGLSTCLIYQGEFVDPEILYKHYSIPVHFKVYCAITLGYPSDEPEVPARMDSKEVTEYLGILPNPEF